MSGSTLLEQPVVARAQVAMSRARFLDAEVVLGLREHRLEEAPVFGQLARRDATRARASSRSRTQSFCASDEVDVVVHHPREHRRQVGVRERRR